MRNLIFTINGGIGKCIVATSVCSALKKKYPNDNLIVVSGYP
jgi:ADP-heptose:LPS heptosyltransferase